MNQYGPDQYYEITTKFCTTQRTIKFIAPFSAEKDQCGCLWLANSAADPSVHPLGLCIEPVQRHAHDDVMILDVGITIPVHDGE